MHPSFCLSWEVIHPGGQPTDRMDLDLLDLNPRIIAAIKKAKLKSVKEVLHFSGPDLRRLTNLSSPEVWHLLRTASLHLRGSSILTGRWVLASPTGGDMWLQHHDPCGAGHGAVQTAPRDQPQGMWQLLTPQSSHLACPTTMGLWSQRWVRRCVRWTQRGCEASWGSCSVGQRRGCRKQG